MRMDLEIAESTLGALQTLCNTLSGESELHTLFGALRVFCRCWARRLPDLLSSRHVRHGRHLRALGLLPVLVQETERKVRAAEYGRTRQSLQPTSLAVGDLVE